VTEAITAARGEVEATEGERPAAASGSVALNTVPTAATAAVGAQATGVDTTTDQHRHAPVTAPTQARGTAPAQNALPLLSA
jgi:hypothetical protein